MQAGCADTHGASIGAVASPCAGACGSPSRPDMYMGAFLAPCLRSTSRIAPFLGSWLGAAFPFRLPIRFPKPLLPPRTRRYGLLCNLRLRAKTSLHFLRLTHLRPTANLTPSAGLLRLDCCVLSQFAQACLRCRWAASSHRCSRSLCFQFGSRQPPSFRQRSSASLPGPCNPSVLHGNVCAELSRPSSRTDPILTVLAATARLPFAPSWPAPVCVAVPFYPESH